MARLDIPEVIEVVQLAFLNALTTKLQARHYALKGGANLRFYEKSPRSSEDMDFDALDIEPWKLADGVNASLRAPVVGALLRTQGIEVVRAEAHKQTDTTQRWKILVKAPGHVTPVSVTGEFSHRLAERGGADQARSSIAAEPVDSRIAGRYGLPPPVLPHYVPAAAMRQKIAALALRTNTQSRDVFDLDWLLTHHEASAPSKGQVPADQASRAAERATELDYADFHGVVVPFIDLSVRPIYDTTAAWNAMQHRVVTYLLGLV